MFFSYTMQNLYWITVPWNIWKLFKFNYRSCSFDHTAQHRRSRQIRKLSESSWVHALQDDKVALLTTLVNNVKSGLFLFLGHLSSYLGELSATQVQGEPYCGVHRVQKTRCQSSKTSKILPQRSATKGWHTNSISYICGYGKYTNFQDDDDGVF